MKPNPWSNKFTNATKAAYHTREMENKYKHQIELSVEHSVIYGDESFQGRQLPDPKYNKTEMIFLNLDTVSALTEVYDEKVINNIGILNFASYKHPGGMFLDGSMAQEEALCHESFLYNVLKELPGYYIENGKHLNRSMYTNRAIFSPDIIFRDKYECGVLTCAAPNFSTGLRYKNVTKQENYDALYSRARFMLRCFADAHCNIIILGAWGCGVFRQDPEEVAAIFKELLDNEFKNIFEKVVIAVPDQGKNYKAFEKVFG